MLTSSSTARQNLWGRGRYLATTDRAHGGSSSSRAPSGAKYSSTAASLTCSSAAGDQRGALVRVRVRVRVGVEALCRGLGWGWSWG
jgi:hypothetical protein